MCAGATASGGSRPTCYDGGVGGPHPKFVRYVALGDSSTEGLDDPDGAGGYRGWADRLAERVAGSSPGLLYANLAVRGRSAGEIAATQLGPALAMRPDLATVVAGMNDLLRGNFDPVRIAGEVATMVHALVDAGAEVVTFTIPDVSRRMRVGRALAARTVALNAELRRVTGLAGPSCARSLDARPGVHLLDLASYDLAHDPRMWSADRLHGNPDGHARIAATLAHLLGLPDGDARSLTERLPPPPPRRRREVVAADLAWAARYVVPWAWRRLRGKTAGDGLTAKRPTLTPVARSRRASTP